MRVLRVGFSLCAILVSSFGDPVEGIAQRRQSAQAPDVGTAVLWRQPPDIASRDLLHGAGGKTNQPPGIFPFIKEDSDGTNPKFVVEDSLARKWKVKLGPEVGPETTATRLLWCVGYLTDEDYFRPEILVKGLKKLNRGQQFVSSNGKVRGARLERLEAHAQKVDSWNWRNRKESLNCAGSINAAEVRSGLYFWALSLR